MRPQRWWRYGLTVAACAAVLGGCAKKQESAAEAAPPGPAPGTPEWKMENAMSAAPRAIASGATLMDWPATPGGQPTQLRAGTNGWTCFPDMPNTPRNDPMCNDAQWSAWAEGWMTHQPPHITALGISYMLQGSADASNTDPFATEPAAGQQWVITGPHVMIIVPNQRDLAGLPTDPNSGGPYVMFAGTPYAHIMVPVAAMGSGMAAGAGN
jgi:hypothetical protein